MKKLILIPLAATLAVSLTGCEAFNGGLTNSSSVIAQPILREAERVCGPRGGTLNIMLMTDREDDGILTCADHTNHYFDV